MFLKKKKLIGLLKPVDWEKHDKHAKVGNE